MLRSTHAYRSCRGSVFEKTRISCALQANASQIDLLDAADKLNLFDF